MIFSKIKTAVQVYTQTQTQTQVLNSNSNWNVFTGQPKIFWFKWISSKVTGVGWVKKLNFDNHILSEILKRNINSRIFEIFKRNLMSGYWIYSRKIWISGYWRYSREIWISGVWHPGRAEYVSMFSTKENLWCCRWQGWSSTHCYSYQNI